MRGEAGSAYWRANLRYIVTLLVPWLAVSYGAGILLADRLDVIVVAGFPLGFWFATQGSVVVFVILIFLYVAWTNALDRRHDVYEE